MLPLSYAFSKLAHPDQTNQHRQPYERYRRQHEHWLVTADSHRHAVPGVQSNGTQNEYLTG